jgi:hypothetical protein
MILPRPCPLICIFAALALPAFASTPPPKGRVADDDVLRVLKHAYEEDVTLHGAWPVPKAHAESDAMPGTRNICADSGADEHGPRRIAVCTSFENAGHGENGAVDLWLLLDPRAPDEQVRIGASKRDIATGGWGTPGEVRFMEIGPGRIAFAIDDGFTQMGWSTSRISLYHAESDRFEKMLDVATHLSNGGVCDPEENPECRAESISLECTLRADPSRYADGHYALALDVDGTRGGRKVKRSIAIPYRKGAYRISEDTLKRDGCDEGF